MSDVGKFAAEQKVIPAGGRQQPGAVSDIFQGGLDHLLEPPVQAAEQDFHLAAFLALERPCRIGPVGLIG